MADSELEILIRFGLDESKARQALAQINNVKRTAKEANQEDEKGTKNVTTAKRELSRAMQIVGQQLGISSSLVRALFNPWTALLGVVVIGTKAVTSANTLMKSSLEALKPPADDMGKALEDMRTQALLADDAFKDAQAELKEKFDASNQAITTQQQNIESLVNSLEKLELSQTKDVDKQAEIKIRYGQNRIIVQEWADAQKILNKEQERAALIQQRTERAAGVAGLDPSKVKAGVSLIGKERETADARLKSLQSMLAQLQTPAAAAGAVTAEMIGAQPRGQLVSTIQRIQAEIVALQRQIVLGPGTERRLATAQADFEAINRLDESIKRLTNELATDRAAAAAGQATGAAVNLIDAEAGIRKIGDAFTPLSAAIEDALRKAVQAINRVNAARNP